MKFKLKIIFMKKIREWRFFVVANIRIEKISEWEIFQSDNRRRKTMDLEKFYQFKRWAIIALFSDDELAEKFVLKGGTALQLRKLSSRASMDIDVSMIDDFSKEELPSIEERLKNNFTDVFGEHGYTIFDFKFYEKPKNQPPERAAFWGGYKIEFKIYKTENMGSLDIDALRRSAEVVAKKGKRIFSIDISKYEFCTPAEEEDLDGYTINIYTTAMIVCEKIRALCQQLPEYFINHGESKSPRPRDFYDIYTIMKISNLSFNQIDIVVFEEMFKIKKVDFSLLDRILSPEYYNFTKGGLQSLIDTLPLDERTDFDFDVCYDYVIKGIQLLKTQLINTQK